jgi:hypothetical protein
MPAPSSVGLPDGSTGCRIERLDRSLVGDAVDHRRVASRLDEVCSVPQGRSVALTSRVGLTSECRCDLVLPHRASVEVALAERVVVAVLVAYPDHRRFRAVQVSGEYRRRASEITVGNLWLRKLPGVQERQAGTGKPYDRFVVQRLRLRIGIPCVREHRAVTQRRFGHAAPDTCADQAIGKRVPGAGWGPGVLIELEDTSGNQGEVARGGNANVDVAVCHHRRAPCVVVIQSRRGRVHGGLPERCSGRRGEGVELAIGGIDVHRWAGDRVIRHRRCPGDPL